MSERVTGTGSKGTSVAVGRIVRAHGVRGLVRVSLYAGESESLRLARRVALEFPAAPGGKRERRTLEVVATHPVEGGMLLELEGVADRDVANTLRGAEVLLERKDLVPLDEGEFYYHDLPGMEVVDEEGGRIGVVTEVFETPAHDVVAIELPDGSEALIPAVADVIARLEVEARRMVVRRIPGLFEGGIDPGEDEVGAAPAAPAAETREGGSSPRMPRRSSRS